MFLRNGRVGILDLSSGESSEEELPEAASLAELSSVGLSEGLISKHGQDSLVLGTGVLTGSFAPASCVGLVCSRGRAAGSLKLMPFMGFAGVELKLSGFDFVVLKGVASSPSYVWIRDGMIELVPSADIISADSWARTDRIRSYQGDGKIQVLASGHWGDFQSPSSQLVVDYWGGDDKVGMGAEFGARNLVAVAFRGMGELELSDPERHFEQSLALMREQVNRLGENAGLASYFDKASRGDFRGIEHRIVSCYGCPFPCRTFLKTREDPKEMRLLKKDPGYLHYDVAALEKAFLIGLDARESTDIMIECAKAGAEPTSVLSETSRAGTKPSVESVSGYLRTPYLKQSTTAANFERSFPERKKYLDCLGLGLCPRYWSKVGFDVSMLDPLVEPGLGAVLR